MKIEPLFRGEPWQETIVLPIDPSRPHRFAEQDVGRRGVCVFCGRFKVSDYHDDDAKQRTFQRRSEYG